jgi:hypothetical protein
MMQSADTTTDLRLLAFDADDLAILSAHVQDMSVRPADLAYLRSDRTFALAGERFDWVGVGDGPCERVVCGLHFERVLAVRKLGLDANKALNLLSIGFDETDAPAGTVTLTFSGGAAIRLEVECLDGHLRDIGPRRRVPCQPDHPCCRGDAD